MQINIDNHNDTSVNTTESTLVDSIEEMNDTTTDEYNGVDDINADIYDYKTASSDYADDFDDAEAVRNRNRVINRPKDYSYFDSEYFGETNDGENDDDIVDDDEDDDVYLDHTSDDIEDEYDGDYGEPEESNVILQDLKENRAIDSDDTSNTVDGEDFSTMDAGNVLYDIDDLNDDDEDIDSVSGLRRFNRRRRRSVDGGPRGRRRHKRAPKAANEKWKETLPGSEAEAAKAEEPKEWTVVEVLFSILVNKFHDQIHIEFGFIKLTVVSLTKKYRLL